ncbi:hypothetical protein BJ875DRAFT_248426 [Amylocarpus encephaloides]|uniref:Aminoglycoside phosphotransferase domain-containing protein n=1 Tax=Amylocarpus encephaloides TaxID=45428 RepID=A0A9P7YLK4_9HELO|nr:hypothetical protein BJ875DRAFT_248426 [Amylocarpus encephaloides]
MSASRTAVPARPHMTSLMYSLPVRRLKEILSHVIPGVQLGPVEELSSPQLPRLYKLHMSDDRNLLLSFAPSLAVRLLRQEATLLSSEATLVYFITDSERKNETETASQNKIWSPEPTILSQVVPKLIKHSADLREMAYPYSIFELGTGEPLSTLSIHLSISERRGVDKQIGAMARALATLTSPSGTFGTVSLVIPYLNNTGSATAPRIQRGGSSTWSEAVNTLVEGILRDGEDISVLLPYETIRAHYQRSSWRLDAVTLPRLAVLDIGSETNIMVSGDTEDTSSPRLTGLRSWSLGVFGDPLIADAFDNPSDGFLEGWNSTCSSSIIEDEENAAIRLLLYRCYRAVVSIVTEHYRPQVNSSRRELEERRKLTSVLAELERVDAVVGDALKMSG